MYLPFTRDLEWWMRTHHIDGHVIRIFHQLIQALHNQLLVFVLSTRRD